MVRSVAPGTRMSLAGVAVVGVAGLTIAASSGILLAFLWVIFCGGCALVIARGAYAWAAELTLSVGGIAIGLAAAARFSAQNTQAWLGVFSLVAGILLLGTGMVHLLAGFRGWWRIPAALTSLLAVAVGVYVMAIPVAAVHSPRSPLAEDAPPGWTDVAFDTSDGVTLRGWFTPSRNGAGVVVVPGSGSNRTGADPQARELADEGYAVLVYDPRGHGESGGRAMEYGWAGDLDVTAAVDFLSAKVEAGRIGALGLSMGGEQVLGAAAQDSRIQAVVAEGATNRVAGDFAWLSAQYGWRGTVQKALNVPRFALLDVLSEQPAPTTLKESVARIAPRSVLLIAAGNVSDEGYATTAIATGSGHVQIWVAPGAGHTQALSTAPQLWRETVLGFFDENLS
ncbi:MAG: alpha/beta fold hydrolase [Candidatus Nanopelagicales bacterium]|nr:alpha/beta fold hydrolase [Candidatus Nanopelagicales bacterium]